ncbi:4-carboxy-4-hydroxy-2-oxoadipate aldolase/oxaloacetate decarboxylase [Halomonas sp.]|uniref:4-carboxy-4-hydroxy-2-oxoadipate aldolase/oxaloacetate decarboxylase n=1 Tax=Halomonas sp. TaxID=1486246 RepID=UPI003A943301
MVHIKTKFKRPADDLIEGLSKFSVATIHEAQGRKGALDSAVKPIDRAMSFCGPAFTVKGAPRDNLMLQLGITYASPGDVLVFSAGGMFTEAGCFGDVLGNAAQSRGLRGLVTDTGVRDSKELTELNFPVFSNGICIKGTVKETLGEAGVPIIIAGETIYPGDIVCGDADGVVVIRQEEAEWVLEQCQARVDDEDAFIREYRSGKTPVEVSGLAALLETKGLVVD